MSWVPADRVKGAVLTVRNNLTKLPSRSPSPASSWDSSDGESPPLSPIQSSDFLDGPTDYTTSRNPRLSFSGLNLPGNSTTPDSLEGLAPASDISPAELWRQAQGFRERPVKMSPGQIQAQVNLHMQAMAHQNPTQYERHVRFMEEDPEYVSWFNDHIASLHRGPMHLKAAREDTARYVRIGEVESQEPARPSRDFRLWWRWVRIKGYVGTAWRETPGWKKWVFVLLAIPCFVAVVVVPIGVVLTAKSFKEGPGA